MIIRQQDPMSRPTGWYEIMRRTQRGTFSNREVALWMRTYGAEYGNWTYRNGEVRPVDERIKDDLVLSEVSDD